MSRGDVFTYQDKKREHRQATVRHTLHDVQEQEFRDFMCGVEGALQSTGMCLHFVRDHTQSTNSSISSVARLLCMVQERFDSRETEYRVIDDDRKKLLDEVQSLRRDKHRVTRLVRERLILNNELKSTERDSDQWHQACCEREDQIKDMTVQYDETVKGMQSLYEKEIDKLKQDTVNKQSQADQGDQAEDSFNPGTPDRPHNDQAEEFIDSTDEPCTSYKGETMEALEQRFEDCKQKLLHSSIIQSMKGSLKPSGRGKRKPSDSDAVFKRKLYNERRKAMDSKWKRVSPSNFHEYLNLMDELKNSKKRQKTMFDCFDK